MKALFVGLGSIGQRHLVNFKSIMGDHAQIGAYRETEHNTLIIEGAAKECDSLERYYGFKQFGNLDHALQEQPDVVLVTNPSSKHLEVALRAARYSCNLFIEKPLSHNLSGINLLKEQVESKNLVAMIGYQTRFHPCYQSVKAILAGEKYGNVLSANFSWGTYLPRHHRYEDYRKSYAALRNLGGGVVLGLIHEIDLIHSFWGIPQNLSAVGGRLSALEMEVEDTVSVLMRFKHKQRVFPVTLFLSYAQTREDRKFRIQLDRATIFCDLLQNTVTIFDEKEECIKQESYAQLKRNDLFLNEMKEFISAVRQKRKPLVSLDDGIQSLNLAIKIKEEIIE